MRDKIVIAVAPTSGGNGIPGNPVRSRDIAADVIACARAGASVVHLHARDEEGRLTTDLTAFNNAVQIIRDSCNVIIEASTGGLSDLTARERALPTSNPYAELGSLNIGSLNFGDAVYRNGLPDVRFWIETLAARNIKPGVEIFDTGDIESALNLINEGLIAAPCNFSFVFNLRWGMVYHPSILAYLKDRVPPDSQWGALLIGSKDFSQHIDAARQGASFLRVGFEDSNQYNGRIAGNNAELVRALRDDLQSADFSIATVDEARSVLLSCDGQKTGPSVI